MVIEKEPFIVPIEKINFSFMYKLDALHIFVRTTYVCNRKCKDFQIHVVISDPFLSCFQCISAFYIFHSFVVVYILPICNFCSQSDRVAAIILSAIRNVLHQPVFSYKLLHDCILALNSSKACSHYEVNAHWSRINWHCMRSH